jgi:hypothetical protein
VSGRADYLAELFPTATSACQPSDVETLTLSRGAKRLVMNGRGGKLVWADGGTADPDDKLAVALDGLRADDVTHFGAARPEEGFAHPSLDVRIETRSDAGAKEVHFVVGDSALVQKERMFYARLDGVDATFAIARDRLAPLLDAL